MNPQQNFRNPRLVVVVSMLLLCDVIVVVVVVVEIRACFGQVAGVDSKEPGLPSRPPTSKLLHELKSFASTEAEEEVGC